MKSSRQHVAKNIWADPWSFIKMVHIKRGGQSFLRHFPKREPNALADAIRFRDAITTTKRRKQTAYSNTGIVGVSETVKHSHNYRYGGLP